jgi:hypothetical protein
MQSYNISYRFRELNIELTTNPNEYGYFCDPGLDIEKGINSNSNYSSKYNSNIRSGYSYNNPDNTIHENETECLDNEYGDTKYTKYTKYNKENASKVICVDNMIYGVIIMGTVTITTYLVNNGII